MDNQNTFDSLFEGMDLTPEFKEQLKTVFEDAVQKKIEEKMGMGPVDTPGSAYAVGTAKAMQMTGDKPPLKKSTIRKAHEIAKGVMKTAGIKEDEEIVTLESESEIVDEADGIEGVDPKELAMDPEMLKVLRALGVNPAAFVRSLQATLSDIEGNAIADDAFGNIILILKAIADDAGLANKLISTVKDMKKAETSQVSTTEEEPMKEEETEEAIEVYESVVDSVDKYLTYIAESWVEENELAVDQGLKLEILESFFNGAKNLLTEHNIEVPEGKNPTEELNAKIQDLEAQISEQKETYEHQLNEQISKTIAYKNRVEKEVKNNIFECVSKDLTVVQKERFKKLVESVTFENKSSYEQDLREIAKNAFEVSTKTSKKNLTEDALNEKSESEEVLAENPVMSLYANAITKNLKF
jgi:hypothetical protein